MQYDERPTLDPYTGFGFRRRLKGDSMAAKKIAIFAAILALILFIIKKVTEEAAIEEVVE